MKEKYIDDFKVLIEYKDKTLNSDEYTYDETLSMSRRLRLRANKYEENNEVFFNEFVGALVNILAVKSQGKHCMEKDMLDENLIKLRDVIYSSE